MTREAPDLLNSRRNDPYEAAVAALREDTQQWWADTLARDPAELEEGEEPFTADPEGLQRFLEDEMLPWFEARKKELANRPLIREQAFGGFARPVANHLSFVPARWAGPFYGAAVSTTALDVRPGFRFAVPCAVAQVHLSSQAPTSWQHIRVRPSDSCREAPISPGTGLGSSLNWSDGASRFSISSHHRCKLESPV